jgi:hypothetical protein
VAIALFARPNPAVLLPPAPVAASARTTARVPRLAEPGDLPRRDPPAAWRNWHCPVSRHIMSVIDIPADAELQLEDLTDAEAAAAELDTGWAQPRVDLRAEASRSDPRLAGAPSAELCTTQAITARVPMGAVLTCRAYVPFVTAHVPIRDREVRNKATVRSTRSGT